MKRKNNSPMKHFGFLFALIFVLTACGPKPTPEATPDVQATAAVFANTMVAATLTAQPTPTLAPTDTPLPTATDTIVPTDVPTLDTSGVATNTPVAATTQPLAGATPTVFTGIFAPGNTDGLPTGLLYIQNSTGVKEIIVSLTGTTLTREQPVFYSWKITSGVAISILLGNYKISVQIPTKGYVLGDFSQQTKDKTTMTVYWNKVVTHGP
jgi:hypothetical protein